MRLVLLASLANAVVSMRPVQKILRKAVAPTAAAVALLGASPAANAALKEDVVELADARKRAAAADAAAAASRCALEAHRAQARRDVDAARQEAARADRQVEVEGGSAPTCRRARVWVNEARQGGGGPSKEGRGSGAGPGRRARVIGGRL